MAFDNFMEIIGTFWFYLIVGGFFIILVKGLFNGDDDMSSIWSVIVFGALLVFMISRMI